MAQTDVTTEEDLQVQTVAHKGRTAIAFGALVWALLAVIFWLTSTPKRWIAFAIAVVLGISLYFALR